MSGPPESPRHASLPPRSKPAQNISSVILYSGKNNVLLRHSLVDITGNSTSCNVSAEVKNYINM